MADNTYVQALDPNSWNSIKEYVEFQVKTEDDLMRAYTNIDMSKLSRQDLSQLPPGFIPMKLRIDPKQTPARKGNHKLFGMYVFKDGEVTGKHNVIVEATVSDRRAAPNAIAKLTGNGLSKTPDENVARREIAEHFNSTFADGGTVAGLKGMLDSLPTIEIGDFEVDGFPIKGFSGAITSYAGDGIFLAENGMLNQFSGIAQKRTPPTFGELAIGLDENNELSVDEMLKQRMEIAQSLGLPLDQSEEQIAKAWDEQLEAGYNHWARETRQILENKGIDMRIPSFQEAVRAQKAIKVMTDNTGPMGR